MAFGDWLFQHTGRSFFKNTDLKVCSRTLDQSTFVFLVRVCDFYQGGLMRKPLLLVLFLLSSSLLADTQPSGITTQGEGVVKAKPDMATIALGVVIDNVKAVTAMEQNTAAVTKMIATIAGFGVDKKDVKTTSFQITSNYAYPVNQKPKLIGYTVTSELEIDVRKLDVAGKLLDELVRDGANRVSSVSFGFTDPRAMLDQAREAAVKDAKRRAEIMAKAAGAKLGALVSLSDTSNYSPTPRRVFMAEANFAKTGDVPLQAGEQGIKVSVNAMWAVVGN
jgi:uncharacterized protein YggE